MKFEINHPEKNGAPEPVWRLELCHGKGGVTIMATGEDGRRHQLLTLLNDGRFHRCCHVDEDSGFKLSKFGRLVECRNL